MDRVLSLLLIPFAIALAFRFFRRWAPPPAKSSPGEEFTEAERKRFARWEAASIIPFIVFAAFLGWGWHFVLRSVGEGWIVYRNPDARYVLSPSSSYWALPALFLGIITSAVPLTMLFRLLLRDRYGRFVEFTNARAGFDSRKILRVFAVLVALGAGAFLLAGVRGYSVFDDNGIKESRVFSRQPEIYTYDSILSIQARQGLTGRRGKWIRRPHYVVTFRGERNWSTLGNLRDPAPVQETRIMRFVSEKSGVPITGSLKGKPPE